MIKKILPILVFLFVATPALGATYYVAQGDGSNSYNGLYDSFQGGSDGPWLTLVYAESQLSDGDTVNVRTGTYEEHLVINVDNVTFQAYTGETPIVDGDVDEGGYPYDLPTSTMGLITARDASGITVDGFTIQYSNRYGIQTFGTTAPNTTFKNNTIRYIRLTGAWISSDSALIENNEIHDHNLTVDSSICPGGLGSATSWGAGITTGTGANTGIIIQGNTVHQGCGEGIAAIWSSANVIVEDNVAYDNRSTQYYIDAADNVTFRRNIGYCTDDSDWWRTPGGYGVAGGVITIGNERDLTGYDGNYYVYNNLCADCAWGIVIHNWGSNPTPVDNVEIYGNTVVEPYTSGGTEDAFEVRTISEEPHANIKVKNNIFINTTGSLADNIADVGVTMDYNCWYNNGDNTPDDADAQGANDVNDNPDLEKTSNWNAITQGAEDASWWDLTSVSPAKDAGITLASPYNECYDEEARPKGSAFDIGAHEFGYVISITATDGAASEAGPDTGTFRMTSDEAVGANLAVNFTLGGTAGSGDYDEDLSGGTLTILNTNTTIDQTITPTDDSDVEGQEILTMTIATGTDYSVGSPSQANIAIGDNEFVEGEMGLIYFGGAGTGAITRDAAGTGSIVRQ